jgi:hypothetical protein
VYALFQQAVDDAPQFPVAYRLPRDHASRDLVILAEHAGQMTAREKERAAATRAADAGFFAEMRRRPRQPGP